MTQEQDKCFENISYKPNFLFHVHFFVTYLWVQKPPGTTGWIGAGGGNLVLGIPAGGSTWGGPKGGTAGL